MSAGLYIHIPFCESKCAYCDFYSMPKHKGMYGDYIKALATEYASRRNEVPQPFTTVYIGGGTPSILGTKYLTSLFEMTGGDNLNEFTIEVNPEHINLEFARFLSESPVTRVSIGIQSFNDTELRAISRRHSARQAIEAVETLREAGIDNISLDLIFGLPEQTAESWETTVKKAIELHPQHISAYALMYEPGTRLTSMLHAGKLTEPPQELSDTMYRKLITLLNNAGYEHYEISNFALHGRQSLHNSSYWNLTPYLGLGPGAHSFDGHIRRFNPPNIRKYMTNPACVFETEHISRESAINEYILIRLRTAEGIALDKYTRLFGETETQRLLKSAIRCIERNLLLAHNGILSIPPEHWLIADSIIVELFV